MNAFHLVNQVRRIVNDLDHQINECYVRGIDCSSLGIAKEALTNHLAILEQGIDYKMDLYTYYGEPPDVDDLRSLIEEIGYDQAKLLYGDELDAALTEAMQY